MSNHLQIIAVEGIPVVSLAQGFFCHFATTWFDSRKGLFKWMVWEARSAIENHHDSQHHKVYQHPSYSTWLSLYYCKKKKSTNSFWKVPPPVCFKKNKLFHFFHGSQHQKKLGRWPSCPAGHAAAGSCPAGPWAESRWRKSYEEMAGRCLGISPGSRTYFCVFWGNTKK